MEVFDPCTASARLDIRSSNGPSTDQYHLTQYNSRDLSMNDLKICLNEYLNIEDTGASYSGLNLPPVENDIGNAVTVYEVEGSEKNATGNSISEKCFSKCAIFPPLHGPKTSGDVFIGEKGRHEEDISSEVPLKSVSAIKGSHEKQGIPPKKLSVTWAPDVYDPTPTSVSHVPLSKNQSYRCNGKKSGKYKHKGGGKSSQGSKGRDKKQVWKNGGGSTKLKPFHEGNGVSLGEPQLDAVDFDVGTQIHFVEVVF